MCVCGGGGWSTPPPPCTFLTAIELLTSLSQSSLKRDLGSRLMGRIAPALISCGTDSRSLLPLAGTAVALGTEGSYILLKWGIRFLSLPLCKRWFARLEKSMNVSYRIFILSLSLHVSTF